MTNPEPKIDIEAALLEVSAALFTLRDACLELSFVLKDQQFETDQVNRALAADTVNQLVTKLSLPRNPSF